jgi:hypothetical protein
MQDPKLTLVNLLTVQIPIATYPSTSNLIVTKDDGTTPPNLLISSAWYTDELMGQYDAIVTVSFLTDPVTPSGFGVIKEDHTYMADVNVWTTNKYSPTSPSTLIITDETLRGKLVAAIDQIIESNRTTMGYGIHRAKVSNIRGFDEPASVPYPLRRSDIEIELYIPTIVSLAA